MNPSDVRQNSLPIIPINKDLWDSKLFTFSNKGHYGQTFFLAELYFLVCLV